MASTQHKTAGDTSRIYIYGQTLTVKGTHADDAYIQALAAHVSLQMERLAKESPLTPLAQVAMLAALNVAHELFQERDQNAQRNADLDTRTREMLDNIEAEFQTVRHNV